MKIVASIFPRREWALLRFREGDPVEASHWTEGPQSRLTSTLEASCVLWCCGSSKTLWTTHNARLGPQSDDPSLKIRPSRPPAVWDLASPTLHNLNCSLRQSGQVQQVSLRFGFRSFHAVAGRFELNGRPIFLRGNSVNPPGRYIDDSIGTSYSFAYSYLRSLKRRHINSVRLGDGTLAVAHYYVLPPLPTQVARLVHHWSQVAWLPADYPDPFGRGASVMPWDREDQVKG